VKICPSNAIVGVSCRLPRSILSLDGLVQALSAPHKAFSTPPPTRWRVPPESSLPNHFGFIDDDVLTGFPFARYGLPRAEAETLDPTHRLILQLVWEALENARLDPSTLGGPRTGVYLGLGSTDWSHQALGPHAIVSAHAGTGAWSSVAAGRIAYTLGITGPTLCVDTACSSGLVAAHLALRDLRSGTIDRAIVASANLLLDPSSTTTLMTLGALSPSGRCRPFDREADGYVRSEGGVALVLENQNVHTQRTRVHGWIAGSAINHDGPSNGLTAPSARAQQAVLLAALKEADWPASSLDLMEAHGTGTPLGDPIEWQALREVYGSGDRPCRVGTLKGTHGHLEAASGLAGLLRILATFRHGRTFPQPWLEEVNPLVSLEGTRLSIPSQSVDGPYLKAGVSAFGLSGTNAHLLVQAPSTSETEVLPQPDTPGDSVVIGLSGPTREAVVDLARHWEQHATACSPKELCGIAQTRAQERFRIAGVVSPGQSPSEVIALCAQGPIDPSNPRVRIGFAYTGQGAQLVNMALPLMAQEPIFQAAMEEVGAVYGQLSGHSLHDILKDEKALNHTSFTQPALFAVEWSLTQLFAAWHLKPDLVLGHSVGEIAAACTAGVFTMEDAMALAVARGRVLGDLPEGGSMAAIEAQPQELLPTLPDDVVIAGFNGPRNTTISGNSSSVQQVVEHWARDHRMAHLLTVSHAFHSPRMASASEGLRTALSTCDMRPPELPWFSTLTGKAATQTSASAAYWSEQLVRPVRFQEAVESAQEHVDIFVELGPRPVLSGLAHGFSSCPWLGTLHASGMRCWLCGRPLRDSGHSGHPSIGRHGDPRGHRWTYLSCPSEQVRFHSIPSPRPRYRTSAHPTLP
jgi:acyl transferase domain-containing protein